jgi:hypothetical protein
MSTEGSTASRDLHVVLIDVQPLRRTRCSIPRRRRERRAGHKNAEPAKVRPGPDMSDQGWDMHDGLGKDVAAI